MFSMSFPHDHSPDDYELTLWGSLKKGELHITLNAAGDEFTLKAGKGKNIEKLDIFSGGSRIFQMRGVNRISGGAGDVNPFFVQNA